MRAPSPLPRLHRSRPAVIPDVQPAAMETQHSRFREHLPRGRTTSGSAPGPEVQRTQKSVGSVKRRRWGALHVRIAWKIYHHKQLKRIQQKSNGRRAGVAPERPSDLRTEAECKDQAVAAGGRRSGLNQSSPPHPKRNHLLWRDKQTGEELPAETALDRGVTSDLGSPGRKDPLRCAGFTKSRRKSVSSAPLRTPVPHVYTAGSPLPCPGIRAAHASGSTERFVPFPGARTQPSWGSMWDIYMRSAEGHPGRPCRLPAAPQGHKLEFYPLCAPPPHFPHRMAPVNLGRSFWTHQLPPPGFPTLSYPGL